MNEKTKKALELARSLLWSAAINPYADRVQVIRAIDEALAAPAAPVAQGWRPISTAPQDGTMFLGWVAAERWSTEDGGGSGRSADVSDVDFCRWVSPRDDAPGYIDNMAGQIGDRQHVSHWMPIPAAPGSAAPAAPVAHVSECEACMTPDTCQLRGTCDHYAAERLRVAAAPAPVAPWEPMRSAPYNPTPDMLDAARRIDPALRLEDIRALWAVMWSAAPAAPVAQGEPVTMTADAASILLRRFKHDEKMLGPHEQAAIDFALEAIVRQAIAAPAAPVARADGMPASPAERLLRRLLAVRVAIPGTYYDDGEAQGTEHGIQIDFMREPVVDIAAKLQALSEARAKCAAPAAPAAPRAPLTDGFVQVPVSALMELKTDVNTLACLSLKAERTQKCVKIKTTIAGLINGIGQEGGV